MAETHQPLLLESSKRTTTSSWKTFFVIISLVTFISAVVLVTHHLINPSSNLYLPSHICDHAQDPSSCLSMVSDAVADQGKISSEVEILRIFLKKSVSHTSNAIDLANVLNHQINDQKEQAALTDCVHLMDLSIDRLTDSITVLQSRTARSRTDAHAWLSSVLTNHVTCLDGLHGSALSAMKAKLEELIARERASLAMFTAISGSDGEMLRPLKGEFPTWVTKKDRRLLQAVSAKDIKADVVVAKDGSGKYKTVGEAVAAAPDNGKTRYVIYVKKGTYKENVEVGKKKKNVMIVGDGMDLTIITGSLNVVDGSTTFKSATVAAVADGFMAQDIWFQNTAGPEKHQAVALRVGADQSVINRCRIDAYQDTLYTHSLRQFYRDCTVTGTVDFIFGDAAVVFQNCKLVARKPTSGQKNMVTAQGRTDPNQNTGTSIQNCEITASSDLAPVKSSFPTYLGRPWKEYSRTVVMQSYIDNHIDPAGWFEWSGDFALKTLYYGEYLNRGPGAGTSKRVKWAGYHVITNSAEANKFTVAELIQGGVWLKSTGVAYTEGL